MSRSNGGTVGDNSEPPDKAQSSPSSPPSRSMSSSSPTASTTVSSSPRSNNSTRSPSTTSSSAATAGASPAHPTPPASTTLDPATVQRDYYRAYDVMIGVRIAATLGGFFTLVVVILLYKSKCKPSKQYNNTAEQSNEHLNDEAIVIDDAGYLIQQQQSPFTVLPSLLYDRGLTFDGLVPPIPQPGYPVRLSNVSLNAGIAHVIAQQQSASPGAISNRSSVSVARPAWLVDAPVSPLAVPSQVSWTASSGRRRTLADCHLVTRVRDQHGKRRSLHVPMMSATDAVNGSRSKRERQAGGGVICVDEDDGDDAASWRRRAEATHEWVKHIDINVIQPTPNASPCGSVNTLTNSSVSTAKSSTVGAPLLSPSMALTMTPRRRLSLASSTSSCTNAHLSNNNLSSSSDADLPSMGSDSVFLDEEEVLGPALMKKQQKLNGPGGSTFLRLPGVSSKELSRSCERLAKVVDNQGDDNGSATLSIPLPVRSGSLGRWEHQAPTGETHF